ncbi:hypothetical protein BGZ93_009757 [Podila epicladia]|nr:hypothetical protein BGZ92_003883 [Podila epicladia]KAG0098964.1 hypothetical protein BGZ93_009757 [Podila epicladia]
MVRLSLPLRDPFDEDYENNLSSTKAECDSTQLIYNNTHCVTSFHFCSDNNPCPSGLPCIDRVCQCLPSKQQYITLAPSPVRMYTAGCNYEKPKVSSCRTYEYGVDGVCLLNYCSDEMPCYAGSCDLALSSCVNITATRIQLPAAVNQVIEFGDDPFGFHQTKFKMTPLTIILMFAGGIIGLAVVGCLLRTALLGIKSSVRWASKGQSVDSNGDEKYKDRNKDRFGNPSLDVKLPLSFSSKPRVDLIRTPTNFNGAHYMPPRPLTFNNSSPYSTPVPSPLALTFVQSAEQTREIQPGQSQTSEAKTSIEIEMEDVGDAPQDITTATMDTEEQKADRDGCVSRSRTQSSTNTFQSASRHTGEPHLTIYKKRSIQDARPMVMSAVLTAPSAQIPMSPLASTTSSPILAPYSPATPGPSQASRSNRSLRLDVNAASSIPSISLGSRSTTSQSYYCIPSPTSPYSIPSPAMLSSRSLANTPSCRKLPAGFASSPSTQHTESYLNK